MSFVGRCFHSSSLISAVKRMHGVSSSSVASFSFYSNSSNSFWRYNDSLISNSSSIYSNNSRLFFSVDAASGKKETKKEKNEASKAAAVSKGAKKANSGDKKMTTDEIEAQV